MTNLADPTTAVPISPEEFHRIFPGNAFGYGWDDGGPAKTAEELVSFCHGHYEVGGIPVAYRTMLQRLPAPVLADVFATQMTGLYPEAGSTWERMPHDMGMNWTIKVLVANAYAKCRRMVEPDGIPAHIIELWAPLLRDTITLLRQNNII